jgi:hypothetical protein
MNVLPVAVAASLLIFSSAQSVSAAPIHAEASQCTKHVVCTPLWPAPPPHFVCPPNAMCLPLLPIFPWPFPWPIWPPLPLPF